MNFLRVLAWAWIIIVGGLLITPGGRWCIKCGPGDPGYLGDTVILVLAVVGLALGVVGIVREFRGRASQAAG